MASRAFLLRLRLAPLLRSPPTPPHLHPLSSLPPHLFQPIPRHFSWSNSSPTPNPPPLPPPQPPTSHDPPPLSPSLMPPEGRTPGLVSVDDSTTAPGGVVDVSPGDAAAWSSPVDWLIAVLDAVHTYTGAPWWITIAGLAVAARLIIFPVAIIQSKKVREITSVLPKLPPPVPFPGSKRSIPEQYRLFKERQKALECPSFGWFFATAFVQIPLFVSSMLAIRRMAFENYPGFDHGGVLYFTDLTVPGHGTIRALLPLVVAVAYFVNLQILFKGIEVKRNFTATLMMFWKGFLEFCTVFIFSVGFFLPQAVYMFWVPYNIWSVPQNWWLRQQSLSRSHWPGSLGEGSVGSPTDEGTTDLQIHNKLILEARKHLAKSRPEEAFRLLKCAASKEPENAEVFIALGGIYMYQQKWSEAAELYQHAISKGKTKELLLAAYIGSGIALFNQGKRAESIAALKAVQGFKVHKDSSSRYAYSNALVTLAKALRESGIKREALKVLQEAIEYNPKLSVFLKEFEQEAGVNGTER